MYCNKISLRAWLLTCGVRGSWRKLSPLSSRDVETKASSFLTGQHSTYLFFLKTRSFQRSPLSSVCRAAQSARYQSLLAIAASSVCSTNPPSSIREFFSSFLIHCKLIFSRHFIHSRCLVHLCVYLIMHPFL